MHFGKFCHFETQLVEFYSIEIYFQLPTRNVFQAPSTNTTADDCFTSSSRSHVLNINTPSFASVMGR